MKNEQDAMIGKATDRRRFVKTLGLAGAAGVALAGAAKAQGTMTDVDIVQFALNLEYLEAEFYTVATTGKTIAQLGYDLSGTGTPGPTTGGGRVPFNSPNQLFTQAVALQIADDERAHVAFLRNTLKSLGVTPVAKPAINLDALGFGFGNQSDFLALARAFEDTGVSAYAGAAPLIVDKGILGYAAQILGTESEHAANIRLQIAHYLVPTAPLDGVDVLPPPSGKDFFSVDSANALVRTRTPGQVLYIVYAAANVTMGGFYPAGVNGTINMSSDPA